MENINKKIEQITSELTGDLTIDRAFLKREIDLALADKEVERYYLSFLTTMYYYFSDVDNIDQFKSVVATDPHVADSLCIMLKYLREENEYDRAIYLGTIGAETFELGMRKQELYPELLGTDYRNFDNRIEEVLYFTQNENNHQLVVPKTNYARFYNELAGILNLNGDAQKADHYANLALKWNPFSADAYFNLSKALLTLGDYDNALKAAINMLNYAYKKNRMADAYEQIARIYTALGNYKGAIAAEAYAVLNEETPERVSDLGALIEMMTLKAVPTSEQLMEYLISEGIRTSPSKDIFSAAYLLGKRSLEKKNDELALKYFTIAYDLIPLEEIKKIIEEIMSRNN